MQLTRHSNDLRDKLEFRVRQVLIQYGVIDVVEGFVVWETDSEHTEMPLQPRVDRETSRGRIHA